MGIDFSVQKDGFIIVEELIENGAAHRAMKLNGVRCPLKQYDEIIEINNVSLNVNENINLELIENFVIIM